MVRVYFSNLFSTQCYDLSIQLLIFSLFERHKGSNGLAGLFTDMILILVSLTFAHCLANIPFMDSYHLLRFLSWQNLDYQCPPSRYYSYLFLKHSNIYCALAKNWVLLPSSIVADEALSRALSLLSAKMSHLGGIPPCSAGTGYLGVPPTVRPLAECQVRSRRLCVPLLSGGSGNSCWWRALGASW